MDYRTIDLFQSGCGSEQNYTWFSIKYQIVHRPFILNFILLISSKSCLISSPTISSPNSNTILNFFFLRTLQRFWILNPRNVPNRNRVVSSVLHTTKGIVLFHPKSGKKKREIIYEKHRKLNFRKISAKISSQHKILFEAIWLMRNPGKRLKI